MRGGGSLPSGTVTFLFTDIERSTESAAALGDERYAEALHTHRSLLRPAFGKHDGVEIGTEGDSFFVAFASAGDAVGAAVEGQRALESFAWPGEARLLVRMGMHTGEALVRGAEYVGHEVNRAKRISDAGHGGQILLSETTADLVRGAAQLLELGSHRLKDLGEPQRIFQVVDDALPVDFPPLRSLDAFTHSLPLQRSAFIGREHEIAEIRKLLEDNRIVTLSGVGGCGKTRLAQQVGAEEIDQFPDGVFFVNLAPIADSEAVPREIAASVGVPLGGGVGGMGGAPAGPTDEALLRHLASRSCLVILDNCEHLIDACAEISDRILARAPQLSILATSREGLRVEGEQAWTVPSLSVPSEGADAHASESVSLFKARAQAVRAGFELTPDNIDAVVEICRRLDGIPLAIEFAAARVSHLTPRQIAERLDDRFKLLTGGQRRVQRQHTLQATLDWSFDLLDETERALLRRLSVFAGSFGIDAAEGVCSDEHVDAHRVTDLLGSLVSKSLIDADLKSDEVRYRLLETVRAYASDRLTLAGEAETFRARHRDWYLDWLTATPWDHAFSDLHHAMSVWREEANLETAIEWSIAEGRHDMVARMTTRMWSGWGGMAEPRRRWVRFALEREQDLDPDDRVRCLVMATAPMFGMEEAMAFADRAVAAAVDASPGVATWALSYRALARGVFGAMTADGEAVASSYRDFDDALDRAGDHFGWQMWVLFNRGVIDLSLARIDAAGQTFDTAMRRAQAAGNTDVMGGIGLYSAVVAHVKGDDEAANAASDLASRVMDRMVGLDRLRAGEGFERFPLGFASPRAAIGARREGTDETWAFLRNYRPHALRSGVPAVEADLILSCAILWYFDGDPVRASKLLGWVRAHTISAGAIPTPASYVLYLHYRDIVRKALGPDKAKAARHEGERLSLDEALDLAFGEKVAP